jgi:hypothetical protein
MLLFVHVYATATGGAKTACTVAVFIDRLKFRKTDAPRATSTAAFAGFVFVITGARHTVVNVHGFGTGPAMSGSPVVSRPPTWMVYRVQSAKGVVWLAVRVVFPLDQENVKVIGGLEVRVTVGGFIASLNVTTMFAVVATPVAAFAGIVDKICGLMPTVRNFHGFGTGLVTRGFPAVSCPAMSAV